MKLGELNGIVSLQHVKVRLPESVYQMSSLPQHGVGKEVVLSGWGEDDFFVRQSAECSKVYPMYWDKEPNMDSWDVVGFE